MDTNKAILLTNIERVSIGEIHTDSGALLIEHDRLRGFLYNSVTPTFEIMLASLKYTSARVVIGGRATLSYDYVFQGRDRKPLEVRVSVTFGNDEQVRVDRFVAPPDSDLPYQGIWDTMNRRIVAYWNGPYFLESRQVSIHDARRNVHIDRP